MQYVLTAFAVTYRVRCQVFSRKFMEQFDAEHNAAFPDQKNAPKFAIPPRKVGYPDTGNGYYSKKLPYAEWFKMNNG